VSIDAILAEVAAERERQDARWGAPVTRGYSAEKWLTVLGEEIGEVCAALLAGDKPWKPGHDLRHELVQVAAVCGAWAEALGEPKRGTYDETLPWVPDDPDMSRWLPALMDDVGCLAHCIYVHDTPQHVAECLAGVTTTAVRWAAALEPDAKEAHPDA
jgi:NTP pyrophosphatase (non-canonical NTP hydrolase)